MSVLSIVPAPSGGAEIALQECDIQIHCQGKILVKLGVLREGSLGPTPGCELPSLGPTGTDLSSSLLLSAKLWTLEGCVKMMTTERKWKFRPYQGCHLWARSLQIHYVAVLTQPVQVPLCRWWSDGAFRTCVTLPITSSAGIVLPTTPTHTAFVPCSADESQSIPLGHTPSAAHTVASESCSPECQPPVGHPAIWQRSFADLARTHFCGETQGEGADSGPWCLHGSGHLCV